MKRRRINCALCLSCVLCSLPTVSAFLGFKQRRFSYEGLIDMGSLGLERADGMIAAVGDVDGEQYLDLFVLSSNQKSIHLYNWDRNAYTFRESPNSTINLPFQVTNVVPGDYDYDGRLDLLIMGEQGSYWGDEELKMVLCRGLGNNQFAEPVQIPSSTMPQPVPFDAEGDMHVDLLAFPYADKKSPQLKLWKNNWAASNGTEPFIMADPPLDMTQFDCKFPNPHSNAFVDLDGDCLADLFLTCQDPSDATKLTYQIWKNTKSNGFVLARSGALPPHTGTITFADMDRDGTMDMVFPTCDENGSNCFINIAYNQQIPLCAGPKHKGPCRDPSDLCVADPSFAFDFTVDNKNAALTRIPLTSLLHDIPNLMLKDTSFTGNFPVPLRIGDYNNDGYPDLLVISSKSTNPSYGHVSVLESKPCDKHSCSAAHLQAGRRSFAKLSGDKVAVLDKIDNARSASFLDIDEDGTLDFMVQRTGGFGSSRKITFIKNNFYHDAFFLKTLVVNGACEGVCSPHDAPRYKPYGVSYSGASYKFTVLDTSGIRRATQVGQLPQTSYVSLMTPYSYFGLGRTNNYVENLFVGSTRHQDQHFIGVEGLIPNSQVVIVPYQPEGRLDTSTWTKQLFLRPGDWIPWVAVTLVAATILLAIVVLVLHISEKREDEEEKKRLQHRFNFDAL